MTTKLLPILGLFALVALAFFGWHSCERDDKDTNVPNMPAEVKRVKILNTDSLKSAIERQYQDSLKAQIKASDERDRSQRQLIAELKRKAATSVDSYYQNPTPAKCDTAIADLQAHTTELERNIAILDTGIRQRDELIWSQQGTILRKDSTIRELGNGWQEANVNAAKWERKAKRRGKVIGFGAAIIAAVIGGVVVSK